MDTLQIQIGDNISNDTLENNENISNEKLLKHQEKNLDFFKWLEDLKRYPIKVFIKDGVKYSSDTNFVENINGKKKVSLFLTNSSGFYILGATSFQDAIKKVKKELNNKNSYLQTKYASINPGTKPLRLSSENNVTTPQVGSYSLIPDKSYKYWRVTVTNAPNSLLSNIRSSVTSYGGNKKRKSLSKFKTKKRKSLSKSKTKKRK